MEVCPVVLTEALSAAAGVPVKLHTQIDKKEKTWKLDVKNLLALVFLGKKKAAVPLSKKLSVIPEDFFDPQFDVDYTDRKDSGIGCMRGEESYHRPYGWMRFGLKVLEEYPDGNAWLGAERSRRKSEIGEWPVSYHGTDQKGAEGVIQTRYQPGGGRMYGRGIYSTPDITVANQYAQTKQFTSVKNGKTYRVILQNRINPQKRIIFPENNYWLVEVPEGTSPEQERAIVDSAIRPYGLLLQEVKKKSACCHCC